MSQGRFDRDIRVELNRCDRNLERGGSLDFWIKRLSDGMSEFAVAAGRLAAKVAELEARKNIVDDEPKPNSPEGVGYPRRER